MNFKQLGLIFIGIAILCILVAGFWGFSFARTYQINTSASQEKCWSYLTDINYYPEWYKGFIRYDKIHGGFKKEGTQYYLFIEDEGDDYKIIETWQKLDSPSLIQKEYQHDFYNLDVRIELLQKNDTSSSVTLHQKVYGTRFIENIFLPLYGHQVMYEQMQNYKAAIKHLEE